MLATASTWSVIGLLAAFSVALLTITWQRMSKFENKMDQQTARMGQLIKDHADLIVWLKTHRHGKDGLPEVSERLVG